VACLASRHVRIVSRSQKFLGVGPLHLLSSRSPTSSSG
jgi:hypothetical protein